MDHEDYILNLMGIAIWQWGMVWALWALHIDLYTNADNIMELNLLWSCNNEAGILYAWARQDDKNRQCTQ